MASMPARWICWRAWWLSVECDEHPQTARRKLEAVLGPATFIVASGGDWTDAETGEIESKLHLHWRLMIPARGAALADLKLARALAIDLVGGDPTAKSIVHPLRWPGSVHRKREPRLCRIVQATAHEIDLAAALAVLKDAPKATDGSSDTAANYFDAYAEQFQTPLDLDAIFAEMVTKNVSPNGKGNLHASFLSLTAAMCNRHVRPVDAAAIEEIVAGIKQRTMAAVDTRHMDWGWETVKLKRMCRDWIGKHPELLEPDPPPSSATSSTQPASDRKWPTLDPVALYGLTGEVLKVFGPHSESDPVALILQFHIAFGNAIGRGAYVLTESTRHYSNLYGLLIGQSARSRKGTSGERINHLMTSTLAPISGPWDRYDPVARQWVTKCISSGLSSGEGVIWKIRDEIRETDKDGNEYIKDPGVDDKRLMLDEREFAQCLMVMKREGSTAGVTVRKGWDGTPINNLTKNSPAGCNEPHISIVGHITEEELRNLLDQVSMTNGYANRFLFACVRRSKLLPFGGEDLKQSDIDALGKKVRAVFDKAYKVNKRFEMDEETRPFWKKTYYKLNEDVPGLIGYICARSDPQVLRLALIYALLDDSDGVIRLPHLKAALALWQYYEDSAHYIFGDKLGDPVADTILEAIRKSCSLTRTQINDLFGRNKNADKIGTALGLLLKHGKVKSGTETSGKAGRPVEVWTAA
jgi:Protein of unknown function (DUF3987)